jgi:hypothetical protein
MRLTHPTAILTISDKEKRVNSNIHPLPFSSYLFPKQQGR